MDTDGRRRAVIEGVRPEIDGGRFPIKRTIGETVIVEADAFADGHDLLSCVLLFRPEGVRAWSDSPMSSLGNDRWRGSFTVTDLGRYRYTVRAWIDRFATWRRDLEKRVEAGQDVASDLLIGGEMAERAARRATGEAARRLRAWARVMRAAPGSDDSRVAALDTELVALMRAHADRSFAVRYGKELTVVVDRERARFGAWYELFPRSTAQQPGRHGTLADCADRLAYVEGMGFDVVYLPPIHPIGTSFRKGKNNATVAEPGEPGSPWAIGSPSGGHTAIHPDLGTVADFEKFVRRADELGMEVALDLAYQCSPDHPWVKEHPQWFRHRPDGTIQYAENPPKRYQDIYPLDFETRDWRSLWRALRDVVLFWINRGVRCFRVDNPHTKAFAFWEWLISAVKDEHPDVIFLSEAFTRPKVMYRLAKLGFTQSYTYFTWRTAKWELVQYFTELTQTEVREYFRANLWPNTPDILPEHLQMGGHPAFVARLVLAATLGASYGIYGPAFEHMEAAPAALGREEYLDSEKYELRWWDPARADSLSELIGRVNEIRRENPALQSDRSLRFHEIDNDALVAYSKATEDRSNVVVMVVNLDPHHVHGGWLELPLEDLGIDPGQSFQVHDLLTDSRYLWAGPRNYVELNPQVVPAHILRVRHRVSTERDFEYFL